MEMKQQFTQTSRVILTERSGGRISHMDCATYSARFFTFVQKRSSLAEGESNDNIAVFYLLWVDN